MTTQTLAVQFHGQNLVAALINNLPHVALKPICENLGLDWKAQHSRIKRNESLNSTVVMTTMVAEDGKLREMLMMPIKYLNGWLFGVDASRVNPEIKPRLIEYQRECFDVLANHFMPQTRYGLLDLPEPPTITKSQAGQLFALVSIKSSSSGKPRAYYWSRFQNHFKLASYKDTPAERFEEAKAYLEKLEGQHDVLQVTPLELDALVDQRVKKALEGELLITNPSKLDNTITISLNGGLKSMYLVFSESVDGRQQRYLVDVIDRAATINTLEDGAFTTTSAKLAKLIGDDLWPVDTQYLPAIIEAAARRLNAAQPARVAPISAA